MFSKRPKGMGPVIVGDYAPDLEIKQSITAGDSVTLKVGEENVLVCDIVQIGPKRYKGRIYGFEPSMELESQGLALEQEVEFNESNVYGCNKAKSV